MTRITNAMTLCAAMGAAVLAVADQPPVQQDRLMWHLDLGDVVSGRWIAVASDGTVYAQNSSTLFAVKPDGSVKWTTMQAGGGENIDIGPDGTIYTGGAATPARDDLVAVNPDGSLKWSVPLPVSIVYGPSLGPDGHLYGAMDNDPNSPEPDQGAFSYTVAGSPRWVNPGQPPIFSLTNDDWPVAFAGDVLAMGVITTAAGGAPTWAFELGGDQAWFGGDLAHEVFAKPVAHPGGFFVTRSHASGMEATAPDGSVVWQISAPKQGFSGVPPAIGPDGVIYSTGSFGDLWAVNADGTAKFYSPFAGGFYQAMSVTPDGSTVLMGGNDIGSTGYVQAFDAADGTPLWQVNMPQQSGTNVFVNSPRFAFSPDGSTAYLTTEVGAHGAPARLYALRVGESCYANCDGSTGVPVLNVADFGCFLNKFAAGDPYANCDGSTGSSMLNVADFGCFLSKFAAGCL